MAEWIKANSVLVSTAYDGLGVRLLKLEFFGEVDSLMVCCDSTGGVSECEAGVEC